ncbi:MAG: SIS domain-containing protein [Deltaproteobacteria bacterium]|nr:SIS domain-containing protein [Deltaproteobacteria bacterium]MBI2974697.1 SIS domain-containing protein [Deltaproteobacteria bacterium]
MEGVRIKQILDQSVKIKGDILKDEKLILAIRDVARGITEAFKNGKKVLLCGNGGSAADAQHIAAEFTGKFYLDRPPLDAEALHVNSSYLTAVANDYSYKETYSRLIKAKGAKGDFLLAFSTSGNSENIIDAIKTANDAGLTTVGFTGKSGGKMNGLCRHLIAVPSSDTPRIQETHILMGHIICELVEKSLFGK